MPYFEPQSVRLKDIGAIQTVQDVQLIGYGLVTGLEGNGDGRGAPCTVQRLANLMRDMGVAGAPQPATERASTMKAPPNTTTEVLVQSMRICLLYTSDAADE